MFAKIFHITSEHRPAVLEVTKALLKLIRKCIGYEDTDLDAN
jgi:hypothetical protein